MSIKHIDAKRGRHCSRLINMNVATSSPSAVLDTDTSAATIPPTSSASSTPSSAPVRPSDWRERRRQSEQRSRQKRKDTLASMPAQVATLERVALVMRILPDPDAVWDEFVDDDTKRLRASLRQLLPVVQEVKQLTDEKAQLQRLLREHQLAKRAIGHLIETKAKRDRQKKTETKIEEIDEWAVSVEHWRELTRLHFRPLTMTQCITLMNDAVAEKHRFASSQDRVSSGMSFMGWRDSRRILASESSLHFCFEKTYKGRDLERHMLMSWRLYSEQQLYSTHVLGGRGRACLDILQQLSPTAWVVRIDENYVGLPVNFHQLFLLFVVDTDKGAVQYLTCIHDSGLQSVICPPRDMWTANYYWVEWVELDRSKERSSSDFRVSVGGYLCGQDPAFLSRWMCEIFAALVRSDGLLNNRLTLEFS